MGFRQVDLWASGRLGSQDAIGVASLARHLDPERDTVADIAAELARAGLGLHALSIFRCDLAAKLRRLELAAELNAGCVIFCAEKASFEAFRDETVAPLLRRAEQLGVALAIENHIDRAIDTIESMERLVREIASSALGFAVTPPHLMALGQDPADCMRRLGPAVRSLYLWDLARTYRPGDSIHFGPPEAQLPGGGQVDFRALLVAVAQSGYRGPLNIGVHDADHWPINRVAEEVGRSKAFIEGLDAAKGMVSQPA